MGKPGTSRRQADTRRCDVFSSASSRNGMPLSFPGSADFFGERFGVGESALHQHGGPAEMLGGLFDRPGFRIHVQNLPHGDAMTGQIGFATGQGVAERDSREFTFE